MKSRNFMILSRMFKRFRNNIFNIQYVYIQLLNYNIISKNHQSYV